MPKFSDAVLNRIARMDVPGVGNVLTIIGFDEDAQARARASIDDEYSNFNRNTYGSNQQQSLGQQQEKVLDTFRNAVLFSPAAAVGIRQLQDRFNYERIPALQAAAQSSGRFTEIISQAFIQQEEYVRDITSTLNAGITTAVIAGVSARNFRKQITMLRRRIKGVRKYTGKVKRNPVGFAVGTAIDIGILAFANRYLEDVVRFVRRDQIQRILNNSVASAILNIEPAAEYYRQTRAIQNYRYEDFQTLQNETEMYAVTIEQMYSALRVAEFSIPEAPNVNSYASQIANLSNFLGVGQDRIGNIFANLAPIGAPSGQSRTLQPVVNAFEKFFVAVSQSVNPSLSQLELVNQMSEFSRNYVFGKKMVTDLSALAQIQDFVSRTAVGDRQTTQPTQAVIRSLDSVLLDYASFSNTNATVFAQAAGISRADAVRGLTGDASVFSNILKSLQNRFKITGEITDEKHGNLMYYLTSQGRGLGLDTQSAMTLAGLVESYSLGNRISSVQIQNALNMTDSLSSSSISSSFNDDGVISFSERRYFDRTASSLITVSNTVSDTFSLFNETMSRVPEVIEMTRLSNTELANKFVDVIGKFSDFVAEALRLLGAAGYSSEPSREPRYTATTPTEFYQSQSLNPSNSSSTLMPFAQPNIFALERNRASQNIIQSIYRNPNARVTGVFGEEYDIPGRDTYRHLGIDASALLGAPLYSLVQGKVIDVGFQGDGYGYYVRVEDALGFVHTFGHLMAMPFVSEGQQVDANTILGQQGNTGISTGSHLHFDVRHGFNENNVNASGRIDPVLYAELVEEYEFQTGQTVFLSENYDYDAFNFVNIDVHLDANTMEPIEFAEKFIERYNEVYNQALER